MRTNQLEEQMRELEYFHALRLLPGAWTVIRVDGRSFSRFTETRFDKPFDERFRDYMIATATMLLEEMQGIYAFTESVAVSACIGSNMKRRVTTRSPRKPLPQPAAG